MTELGYKMKDFEIIKEFMPELSLEAMSSVYLFKQIQEGVRAMAAEIARLRELKEKIEA